MNSETPEVDSDERGYPSPDYAQRIQFEGCECVVMSPEDYEELYLKARKLETERNAAISRLAKFTEASSSKSDWCPCCKQGWESAKDDQRHRVELHATQAKLKLAVEALERIANSDQTLEAAELTAEAALTQINPENV